jgi:hypothetical protein
MTDWNPTTVLIPLFLLLITAIFFLFGQGFFNRNHQRFSSDEHCESLVWTDIPDNEVLNDGKLLQIPGLSPEHGKRCWDAISHQVFNKLWKKSRARVQSARRPKQLGTLHQYLRIDLTVLHALIFICAVEEGPKSLFAEQHGFNYDGIFIEDIQVQDEDDDSIEEDTNIVTAHLVAASPHRALAKMEVDRLLEGFPPWFYKDTFLVNAQEQHFILPNPIRDIADFGRGGWIIALGLTNAEPVPLYYDHPWETFDPLYDKFNFRTRRGGYFWQSIICVRNIIRDNFVDAFPNDTMVDITLKRINAMIVAESDQPELAGFLSLGMTRDQCEFAINTFNSPSDPMSLRRFLAKVLAPVLHAATSGVGKALRYIKTPGRELNSVIPRSLRDSSAIFLRDC